MSMIIQPTVGRVVWFHPSDDDVMARGSGTLAAIVANVWSDTCVNLAVFDGNGNHHSRTSVLLVQEGNPVPTGGMWCEWMPYQKGQAAKTDAVMAELRRPKVTE